ncbi:hypothetical protein [Henriciella litoralis]|uniref:hypothetical protein n=1 Tax=Henriciella litoralis TaxID=568102 RepID=UPI000A0486F9|nr:hypothetical protein [Henriciella litoralis]
MVECNAKKLDTLAPIVSLDEGIELLEKGKADACIRIDFGNGLTGEATSANDLDNLLQRARGLRLITIMSENRNVERPASMRSGSPTLHAVTEEILDALRQSS